MRRNLFLIALAMLVLAALTYILDADSTPALSPAAAPEVQPLAASVAPDFSFTPLDYPARRLQDLRGRVVILNFWASWCAPCRSEFPKLAQVARKFPGQTTVLALSVDASPADIHAFLKRIHYKPEANLLIARDPAKKISQDLFQTVLYPETIIIDPEGRMVRKVVGDTDWTGPAMTAYLSGLAQIKPIP